MTKRVAKKQMTQDNWMNEEESEEAGLFSVAAEEKLQGRLIKKAKRRIPETKNGVPSTPFASFAGFVSTKSEILPTFAFQQSKSTSNGGSPMLVPKKEYLFKPSSPAKVLPIGPERSPNSNKSVMSIPTNLFKSSEDCAKNKTEFLEKLKSLNQSFIGWVQEHMSKNSYCDFTPVCTDYIDHVKKLHQMSPSASPKKFAVDVNKSGSSPVAQISTPSSGFSFFSQKETPQSINSPKPFSFSSQVASSKIESSTDVKGDDENYVPPKNEFEAVKESDALYSKRCKLFFKKGETYVDKGIGTIFLKKLAEKIQLIVRADTSLGNILLNIMLTESLPISRLGKNNVLIVCILNPNESTEPTSILFRVKTSQDADELLENLNKYKTSPH